MSRKQPTPPPEGIKKPDPPPGPPNVRVRMGQKPPSPGPGLPRRGERHPTYPEPRRRLRGLPFWRTTDQVVRHLNRQTRSDPPIKRDRLMYQRDIMFQIRVMDWMIGFCVVVLGVVLCVGAWAIWQMVTRGWLW